MMAVLMTVNPGNLCDSLKYFTIHHVKYVYIICCMFSTVIYKMQIFKTLYCTHCYNESICILHLSYHQR